MSCAASNLEINALLCTKGIAGSRRPDGDTDFIVPGRVLRNLVRAAAVGHTLADNLYGKDALERECVWLEHKGGSFTEAQEGRIV